MATKETRTRWHRNGSRCYIHESPKEASKFSCCSSSSPSSSSPFSSSSSELDRSPDNAAKEPHNTISDYFSPYPNSDPPSARQWWLKKEPNFARHKDFVTASQQVPSEDEFEILSNEFAYKELQISGHEAKTTQGLKSIVARSDPRNVWYLDDNLMDFDSLNSLVSEEEEKASKKLGSDFETHLIGSDKAGPWWRNSGKDDLASLVAQKSLEIENCDLPRPRVYRKQSSVCSKSVDRDDILASSLDRMVQTGLPNLDNNALGSPNLSCSPHDQTFRTDKLETRTNPPSEDGESKAQLMRALCLSQRRAREAEKAAERAHTEKEHVITLIFRQASQLFAYKQWIQLLQLENICLQIKNKNQPVFDLITSPWTPRQVRKSRQRKKPGTIRHNELCKCFVAFALGLGLAGAGLLLGWTMGWLFPSV